MNFAILIQDFLKLTDSYDSRIDVLFSVQRLIITSQLTPQQLYPEVMREDVLAQILRRITVYRELQPEDISRMSQQITQEINLAISKARLKQQQMFDLLQASSSNKALPQPDQNTPTDDDNK